MKLEIWIFDEESPAAYWGGKGKWRWNWTGKSWLAFARALWRVRLQPKILVEWRKGPA